jgi:hypothetical protein
MAAPNPAGIARGSAGLWLLCHRRSASGLHGAFGHELFERLSRLARLLSLRSAPLHGPWAAGAGVEGCAELDMADERGEVSTGKGRTSAGLGRLLEERAVNGTAAL